MMFGYRGRLCYIGRLGYIGRHTVVEQVNMGWIG